MISVSGWTISLPQPSNVDHADVSPVRVVWPTRSLENWDRAAQTNQLREIAQLRDDWDGCGAAAIEARAVAHAEWILGLLDGKGCRPDFVLPSAAGTIVLEWDAPLGGAHLELGKSTFGFYTSPMAGESIMRSGSIEVLNAEEISFALATIVSNTIAHSVESRNRSLGI